MTPAARDESLRALASELSSLAGAGVVPGGAAALVAPGGIRWSHLFGSSSIEPAVLPVSGDTIWDCASLTKPLVTTALVLERVAAGRLRLDDSTDRLVPEILGATRRARPRAPTVGELLTHSAGLPPWEPLAALAGEGLADQVQWLGDHRDEPGRVARYGCPAYHVLALLLEREDGRSFAAMARDELLHDDGGWMPLPRELRSRAAPTERDNAFERELARSRLAGHEGSHDAPRWREGILQGEVHDHGAHVLGGAAGNAGLFATLAGVARLVVPWLEPTTWLPECLARELGKRQSPDGPGSEPRTWGWQLAESPDAAADASVSPGALAHSGFTGTSVVIDMRRRCAFVLLTNRVHPEWTSHPFNADRRRLHALAMDAWDACLGD